MRPGSSSHTSGHPEEQSSGDETDSSQDNTIRPGNQATTISAEMETEALSSLVSQIQAIVEGASVAVQQTEVTATQRQDGNEDYYARIDSLLLRDPQDRAALLSDYRSIRLRELSASSTVWTRTTAATVLDNWNIQIGDYNKSVRRAAIINRPIVTLRTGSTVHSGHLSGLLGGGTLIRRSWIRLGHS